MKVVAITDYNDLQLKRLVKAGEEIEVTEARAKVLTAARVAKALPTPTTEEVAKAAPVKKSRKKKEA